MSAKKSPEPKLPEGFYDNRTSQYWLRLENRFLQLSARDFKLHMMRSGFYIDEENDFGLKSGDAELLKIQINKCVDFAGPLAGRRVGIYEPYEGKKILVTSQANPVQPKKGKFDRLEDYLGALLGTDQMLYFLLWLKLGWTALQRGGFTPGQLVVLAGKAGCGKSFCHRLITELFGGRAAKPYRYMTGQTNFNSDLAGAEHLYIEDESAKSSVGARREFGTAIKDWTVNEEISVHAKGRDAISLSFFRRLSLSVNWETEYLMILPPMDESIMDKIMLFKCSPAPLDSDREKNIAMLKAELPGLLNYMLALKVPKALRDDRFGVRSYHNPEILEVLADVSKESRLLSLIDQVVQWDKLDNSWEGTSEELEKVLYESAFKFSVEKLLNFEAACGTFLARLTDKMPARFEKRKNKGRTKWLIKKGE